MSEKRPVSFSELRRSDGERGRPKFIAVDGQIYDVTDCPKWLGRMHEGLHFPGQDLTSELPEAPHDREVLDRPCVRHVGPLAEPENG